MMLLRVIALPLLILLTSCTAILVETTDEQGIRENPTERTAGAVVEDKSIETKIAVNMKSQQPAFRESHFDVKSYNGVVLMVGQVQSEALRRQATDIASRASAKIKRIHNELEVGENSSMLKRTSDNWIATKVRTKLIANRDVPADQIDVITENGAVYLMGLVSEAEGDNAANVAREVAGVTRVVKVFEYLN